jgi:YihY family inner membrane protein
MGGRLDILQKSFNTFTEARAAQAAASMAYYAFFSLFPLMLVLIAVGSYFLESDQAYARTLALVKQAIPVSNQLIERNLQTVLEARGTISLIALIGLVWSATGVFSGLAYNINLAWPGAEKRNFFEKRLVALGMLGILTLLLIISLVLETSLQLLSGLRIPVLGNIMIYESSLWTAFSYLAPWLFIFILFLALYRWTPVRSVNWKAALIGAVIASTGWKLATSIFTWYLNSGLGRYDVIYGSLGAVVALMFLIYIISTITLFGAHLSAAIQKWMEQDK